MTAPAVSEDPEDPPDDRTILLAMTGARLQALRNEETELARVRRILIAEMAQHDGSLCCTASFVDVGDDQ